MASNCNAIKFGTTSYGTWRDVTVENCAVRPCETSSLRRFRHTKSFRRRVVEAERSYPENRMFGHILPVWGIYLRHADDVRLERVNLRLAAGDARPDTEMSAWL